MPDDPGRSRAARTETAGSETGELAGEMGELATLIVNAARTRLRRRAMWRYQRAGRRPYAGHADGQGDS